MMTSPTIAWLLSAKNGEAKCRTL